MALYSHEADCSTGEVTVHELPAEAEAAHLAAQEAAQAHEAAGIQVGQEAEAQRAADLAAVRAHAAADPASPWASLARLVGAL